MQKIVCPTLLVLLAVSAPARASVIMKMKKELFSKEARTCEMVVAIDQARGRVDTDCGPKKMTIITVKDMKAMLMVDFDAKSYFEMTQDAIEKMQTNPMDAMKSDPRYAAQLAKLTPEQKAMMDKMMADAVKKMASGKAEFKKIGKMKKVGSWSCTTYAIYFNGKLSEDLCIANPSEFPTLAPVMSSWKSFMSGWMKMARSPNFKAHEQAAKLGISVETLIYAGGELKSKMDLVDVKTEDRPDSFYQVPADFTKATGPLPH